LFAVLQIATHELRDLQARHREVNRRIRSVRSAVNALRRLNLDQAGEPEMSLNPHQPATSVQDGDELLVRACRIALLETYDPLSVNEIYARIVRRGSFHFGDAPSAESSITRQLLRMASHGEVLRIVTAYQTKWQRI